MSSTIMQGLKNTTEGIKMEEGESIIEEGVNSRNTLQASSAQPENRGAYWTRTGPEKVKHLFISGNE